MAKVMIVNPKGRKKAVKRKAPKRARRSAVARAVSLPRRRRLKRNPIGISKSSMVDQLKAGAAGGAGAFAVEAIMAKVPFLASLNAGAMAPFIRGAVGVGVGILAGKLLKNKSLGVHVANGAIAVQAYNLLRVNVGSRMGLSGFESDGLLGIDDGLLGFQTLGYYSPAPVSAGSLDGFQTLSGMDDDDDDDDEY